MIPGSPYNYKVSLKNGDHLNRGYFLNPKFDSTIEN